MPLPVGIIRVITKKEHWFDPNYIAPGFHGEYLQLSIMFPQQIAKQIKLLPMSKGQYRYEVTLHKPNTEDMVDPRYSVYATAIASELSLATDVAASFLRRKLLCYHGPHVRLQHMALAAWLHIACQLYTTS